jgi:hypothetical protein
VRLRVASTINLLLLVRRCRRIIIFSTKRRGRKGRRRRALLCSGSYLPTTYQERARSGRGTRRSPHLWKYIISSSATGGVARVHLMDHVCCYKIFCTYDLIHLCDSYFPRDTPLGNSCIYTPLHCNKETPMSFHLCSLHLSLSTATYCNTLSALSQARNQKKGGKNSGCSCKEQQLRSANQQQGMEHTVSMCIRRMREVLHIVDDAMLEAFTVGQATVLPPVHAIPERRVQVQNVHFCVIHGWTAVVPLPVVECGLPTASPSPPVPVVDVGSSASAPMDVDLEAPPPPPPTAEAVTRRSSSPPAPVVVGTIAARRGQPARVVDAPSGRIIFTGHHPNGVAPYSSSNRRA